MEKSLIRIAIVNGDLCNPSRCQKECKSICPVNRIGKQCISIVDRKVETESKGPKKISSISESLCIGCGMCQRACPFGAIQIINLPRALPQTIHRYSLNSFKLCNLPIPRPGSVLGLVGENGVGKSTSMLILANKIIPNFGEHTGETSYKEVLRYFRGTEMQNYFTYIYTKKPMVLVKPQYVESIQHTFKGKVQDALVQLCTVSIEEYTKITSDLSLSELWSKNVETLSGGELQRFTIGCTLVQEASIYMFDEPSSYLDILQRVNMAKCIRDILVPKGKYIIVVEHDLSVLDYLSDYICCLYGEPGAYGIISPPFTSGEGINVYLDGFIPTDNTRFRDEPMNYKFASIGGAIPDPSTVLQSGAGVKEVQITATEIQYPILNKKYPGFSMTIDAGTVRSSEIICLLGSNGSGKCLHPDTPLLLYDGTIKTAKEIEIGCTLMGDDGIVRNVHSICQGEDEMFEITPSKGKSYIVNSAHILTVMPIHPQVMYKSGRAKCYSVKWVNGTKISSKRFTNEEDANKFKNSLPSTPIDISLADFMSSTAVYKKWVYGYHVGVDFTQVKDLPMDPYLFGYWLGGGTSSTKPQIMTADPEIVKKFENDLKKYDLYLSPSRKNISYIIRRDCKKGNNTFLDFLQNSELLNNKHIPHAYKTASRSARLQLLAGLIDSDGRVNGARIEIIQKNARLSKDIEYLVFSLGFMITSRIRLKSYTHKGEKRKRSYHHIVITGDLLHEIPTIIERNKIPVRSINKRAALNSLKVKSLGMGKYNGFEIDGNGRFLLGDFTVTHNTTFIKILCGLIQPDNGVKIPLLSVSYKPQILKAKFDGTVRELFHGRILDAMNNAQFKSDVIKPLSIERLYDHHMSTLSGGELQRVGIVLALGKPAEVLLLDEPSSFLDVGQRLAVAKVIKRHVMNAKKYCFLVEHDILMSSYMADRVIVLEKNKETSRGSAPMSFEQGFNTFLKLIGITFRRDARSMRPRINKIGSARDRQQKTDDRYFDTDNITAEPISSFAVSPTPVNDW